MCLRRARPLLVLPILLLVAADPADNARKDAERLQGAWIVSAAVRNGDPATAEQLKDAKVVFKGDVVTFLPRENDAPAKVTFRLAPAKSPKEIDMSGPEPDLPVRGIYELKGDALRICIRPAGGKRPTDFDAKAGSACLLYVLKRGK